MEAQDDKKLFKIGDEVLCDCMYKCGVSGVIIHIDHKNQQYDLSPKGIAFFDTARKLTKLEKALK